MKRYTKPTLEVVQIRVQEDIANHGDTTGYSIDSQGEIIYMGFSGMRGVS